MRVLVTGGAGFIGSHLVDALLARGDSCTVLDDLSRGDLRNLPCDQVDVVEGCVTDRDLVERIAPGHDQIFHLASVVGVRSTIAHPARVIDVAVEGTANVLRAADPDAHVLVASSSEVYGRSPEAPFDEDTPAVLGPPRAARWSYAHAKACVEHLALAAGTDRTRPPAVVRYFNVYGPRMPRAVDPSVVTQFLDAAGDGRPLNVHGAGHQTRSFVFVNDAVEGTLAAITGAAGHVVNLGGPTETTIAGLAALVVSTTGSRVPIRIVERPTSLGPPSEEPRRRSATGTLAFELLAWAPRTNLADGLARTWAQWPPDRPSDVVADIGASSEPSFAER